MSGERLADIRRRLEQSKGELYEAQSMELADVEYLLRLLDFLGDPFAHGRWAVSREYMRTIKDLLYAFELQEAGMP